MKIVATIEARMTSTRLPGKVLLPAMGKPMLHHLLKRLRAAPGIDEIVLATTINATDEVLIQFAKDEGVLVYRGSEEDVMTRVIEAAEMVQADAVVEITGDNPLIDPDIIGQAIAVFKANAPVYVGDAQERSYPLGMAVQVFPLDMLKRSAAMTSDRLDHEHVTLHIRNHPEIFPLLYLAAPPSINRPDLSLTMDEPADYELLKLIIEYFGESNQYFSCLDIIHLFRTKPELIEINQTVRRKGNT